MTYTVRVRGDSTADIVAEYRCPRHGVFEATVARPAPDEMPCPVDDETTDAILYTAGACRAVCGLASPWCISAPAVESEALKVRAVSLGGDMKERPPGMLDTRKLGSGEQTMTQWKKERREERIRRRHKQLVDKGVISKKVIVG